MTVNITTGSASATCWWWRWTRCWPSRPGVYAVEVVGADNTRRLVPVTVGLFDDTAGLVQVTGNLTPGERVVVPNI